MTDPSFNLKILVENGNIFVFVDPMFYFFECRRSRPCYEARLVCENKMLAAINLRVPLRPPSVIRSVVFCHTTSLCPSVWCAHMLKYVMS